MRDVKEDLKTAWQALEDKKGQDLVLLDVSAVSSFADYFLIASGQNTRQTQAMADAVVERLKENGLRADHVEGYQKGEWILIDYTHFLVHVFVPAHRSFYNLEKLWSDGKRVRMSAGG
ncbi:MAG TPA: ribosome silencing factor [Acidobacteriota bacterium]|jgi:ribosome-associated protein